MEKKYLSKLIILSVLILLFFSCGKSPEKARKILQDNKISFNPSEFVYRAQIGDLDTLKLFLIAGMSPDTTDSSGLTPLTAAIESENIDLINLLLDNNADINKPDSSGNTALFKAILKSNPKIINLVLSNNPDINIANNNGETPLIITASKGKKEIVNSLLNLGAKINQVENKGWTPLMYASFNGHFDIVNILIEHKADLNSKNNVGKTAYMYAIDKNHKEIMELFKSLGAKGYPKLICSESGWEIEGEEGPKSYSGTSSWRAYMEGRGIVNISETQVTYENSGNTYDIQVTIWRSFEEDKGWVTYRTVYATGGLFGSKSQTCSY